MNFFGLNEQVQFVDHFGKFKCKSFRGKGVIFALKVWAIPTKNSKSWALMGELNPTLPGERQVFRPLHQDFIDKEEAAN